MIRFVDSGPTRLWTERFGDPADPVVLLVAGAEAQGISWPDELVDRLVAGGRQVVRYDHRDTGQSDVSDGPYTMTDLAADAVAVLDGHGIAAAHVAGASMGGNIAQWLAVHHPERVRTLTLIATTPNGEHGLPAPDPAFLHRLRAAGELPRDTIAQRVAADVAVFEVMNGDLPLDRATVEELAHRWFARATDWRTAVRHHEAIAARDASWAAPLSGIVAPTLVIGGTADPFFPPVHAEALAAAIPGARIELIPGMGHTFYAPGLPVRLAGAILDQSTR